MSKDQKHQNDTTNTGVKVSTQTDDESTINTSKQSSSPKSEGSNKEVTQVVDVHDKAYKYLESLEEKYSEELDSLYEKTDSLMAIFINALPFSTCLKKAIEEYKTIEIQDKENFILVQFLEVFYEKYAIFDKYHTCEAHENDFKYALSLAYETIDNKELLGNIYNISDHD